MSNLIDKQPKLKPQPDIYKIKLGPDKPKPKPPKKPGNGWLIKWGKYVN